MICRRPLATAAQAGPAGTFLVPSPTRCVVWLVGRQLEPKVDAVLELLAAELRIA